MALSLLTLSSAPVLALDPPPTCSDALWWGTWAKARISPKTIHDGDLVTITLDVVGGPPEGTYCNSGAWTKTGTGAIDIHIPGSCFELVDYSPKASSLRQVTVDSRGVHWRALNSQPTPPTTYNETCWCRWSTWGTSKDMSGCPTGFWKGGQFSPGETLTVTLRAKCSRVDNYWSKSELASLSGHWGLNWGYSAEDYYKLGGETALTLVASPESVPADGASVVLSATVSERDSGVLMPRTEVAFGSSLGILDPAATVTDAAGVATAALSSPGVEGIATVTAAVPGDQDQAQVTFTHVDNPPSPADGHFGDQWTDVACNDPVNTSIGNYYFTRSLFGFPGKGIPFDFEITYNSLDSLSNGPLGFGWTHAYNVALTPSATGASIRWGDGHVERFTDDGSGGYRQVSPTVLQTLTKPDPSHYLATFRDGKAWRFDSTGRLLSIADANGNQLSLTWSTAATNRLDAITDTAGRTITFNYDAAGRITTMTSPLRGGHTVEFRYDASGDLIGVLDPRGQDWAYTYDSFHPVVTVVDAAGTTTLTNTYDASGRVSRQVNGAGDSTAFEYSVTPAGTTTTVTPPSGNAVRHVHDPSFRVLGITDGEGRSSEFQPDALGRLVAATDKGGAVAQTLFGADGNPTLARDRTGAVTRMGHDARNRPTSVSDPLGNTTTYKWDEKGNLTGVSNANGHSIGITVGAGGLPTAIADRRGRAWGVSWDAGGVVRSLTDPTGAVTRLTSDAAGRVTAIERPAGGGTVSFTYDEIGNVLTESDPLGSVTRFTYDANGRLSSVAFVPTGATTTFTRDWAGRVTRVVDALGGSWTAEYDADGNLTASTDPDGVVTRYEYDRSNRLVAVLDALGHRLSFGYDAAGNVTSRTDALGSVWQTTYDAEGRPVLFTDPLGGTRRAEWDAAGRLVSESDAVGGTSTHAYDRAGWRTSTTLPDQGVVRFTRDRDGRPLSVADPMDHAWSFSWHGAGRPASACDPSGKTESYTFDAAGRLTGRTQRDGASVTQTWDANDRLTGVTASGEAVNYTYDAAGNPLTMTDPSGTTTMTWDLLGRRLSKTDPSGKTVSFTYTPAGRLRTVTYPGGKVLTRDYDTAGRLARITDWLGNRTTFQYDATGRVTEVVLPNGTRTAYTWDAAGRLATRTTFGSGAEVIARASRTYDAAGRVTSVDRTEPLASTAADASAAYTYDSVNRLLSSTANGIATLWAFDARGNAASRSSASGTTTYVFDARNLLVSSTEGTTVTTYRYDGEGNRLERTANGATTRYVRDGTTLYCTLDGSGAVTAYHVWGGPLLYTLDAAGAIRVYHADERGSVLAVTDAARQVVQSYAYDPYGKVTAASGSLDDPFRFVGTHGVVADPDGLYHMGARVYDPESRRFLSEDPLGLAAGLNLYAYADGNPVSLIDPEGTETKEVDGVTVPVDANGDFFSEQFTYSQRKQYREAGYPIYYWATKQEYIATVKQNQRAWKEYSETYGPIAWSLGLKAGFELVTGSELTTAPGISTLWTSVDDAIYGGAKGGIEYLKHLGLRTGGAAVAGKSAAVGAPKGPTAVTTGTIILANYVLVQSMETPEQARKTTNWILSLPGRAKPYVGDFIRDVFDDPLNRWSSTDPHDGWKRRFNDHAFSDGLIVKDLG